MASKQAGINGVGYRAQVQGRNFSWRSAFHDVIYDVPGRRIRRMRRSRRKSCCRASTSSASARSPLKSANSVRPSRTRAKAFKYADEYIVRKEGKKK
jgi:large subunit ribosomal protein L6